MLNNRILFVKNAPALFLEKERCLAVSDLHIGMEFKFVEEGIHFSHASARMARKISALCRENRVKRLIIIGDVKQSISYPERQERDEIKEFFESLECKDVTIVKGNHDGRMEQLLRSMGFDYNVCNEISLGKVTFLHGIRWPGEAAFMGDYIVEGHSHFAARVGGINEKVWLMSKAGNGMGAEFKSYNREIKLIVMPAFNDLIIGKSLSAVSADRHPLFKNRIFKFDSSDVYTLSGELLGSAKKVRETILD